MRQVDAAFDCSSGITPTPSSFPYRKSSQRLSTLPPLALTAAASRVPSRLLNTRSSGLGVSNPNATAVRGILILFSSRERSPIPRLDAIFDVPARVDDVDIRSRDPKAVGSGFTQALRKFPGVETCVAYGRLRKSGSSSKISGPESTSIGICVVGGERSPSGRMLVEVTALDSGPDDPPLAICAFSANFDTGLAPPGRAEFGTERRGGVWGFEVVLWANDASFDNVPDDAAPPVERDAAREARDSLFTVAVDVAATGAIPEGGPGGDVAGLFVASEANEGLGLGFAVVVDFAAARDAREGLGAFDALLANDARDGFGTAMSERGRSRGLALGLAAESARDASFGLELDDNEGEERFAASCARRDTGLAGVSGFAAGVSSSLMVDCGQGKWAIRSKGRNERSRKKETGETI